jgi:hypothetical protein
LQETSNDLDAALEILSSEIPFFSPERIDKLNKEKEKE